MGESSPLCPSSLDNGMRLSIQLNAFTEFWKYALQLLLRTRRDDENIQSNNDDTNL